MTAEALDRALTKVERTQTNNQPNYQEIIERLKQTFGQTGHHYPRRLPSKTGDRVQFVDVDKVTHFFAEGKLTYAATPTKNYVIDDSIVQLESRLDPSQFQRIHRSYMVNLSSVAEVCTWFGGKMIARLNDPAHTELPIARDRVRNLKERLGF